MPGVASKARRQYRDCAQLLAQEFGSEPAAETQHLQRLVKGHDLPMPTLDQLQVVPGPTARRAEPVAAAVPTIASKDELQLLTVVCAGLRALPDEAEDLDQEAAAVTHLFTLTSAACAPYGGQVECVPGGDLLLLFGRDQIHEDDPERAVRAAFDLQTAAQRANLPVQIGVNRRKSTRPPSA